MSRVTVALAVALSLVLAVAVLAGCSPPSPPPSLLTADAVVVPNSATESVKAAAWALKRIHGERIQICDEYHDEVEILAAINSVGTTAPRENARVLLLPGGYQLDATLRIPPTQDFVFDASRAIFGSKGRVTGDLIQIDSAMNCQFYIGLIIGANTGDYAALRIMPREPVPIDRVTTWSPNKLYVNAIAKAHNFQQGVGVALDAPWSSVKNCTIEIGEINGYNKGISIVAGPPIHRNIIQCLWIYLSPTCYEDSPQTHDNIITLGLAKEPGIDSADGLKISGFSNVVTVLEAEGLTPGKAVILMPGARGNIVTLSQSAAAVGFTDSSGNTTNQVIAPAVNQLRVTGQTMLTISNGAVTKTRAYHSIETEGGAAADDLDTINGGVEGDFLVIRAATSGHTVTVRHGAGNIRLRGKLNVALDDPGKCLQLFYNGTNWVSSE